MAHYRAGASQRGRIHPGQADWFGDWTPRSLNGRDRRWRFKLDAGPGLVRLIPKSGARVDLRLERTIRGCGTSPNTESLYCRRSDRVQKLRAPLLIIKDGQLAMGMLIGEKDFQ